MTENIENALDELNKRFGDKLTTSDSVRDHHSRDESWHTAQAPDAVLFAHSTEDVSGALEICNRHKVPVVPFGGSKE